MLVNLCTVVLIMIQGVEGLSLNQAQKVLVKQKGKTVSFRCEVTGLGTSNFVHWYHKKDGGTFKRLLYISHSGVATGEAKEFVSEKTGNSYDIKLKEIKEEHAGMYHCACWDGNLIKRFGTGTRLIVTAVGEDQTTPPVLSAYLPLIKTRDEQTMVCQASGMFPDLVKFTWKKKIETSDWTDVQAVNVVEQRNETPNEKPNGKPNVIVTSVMIDKNTAGEKPRYNCTVEHEGSKGTIIKELKKKGEEDPTKGIIPTGSPTVTEKTLQRQISVASEQMPGLYLFVYAYGIMLMKNGAYFCAISIFLLKRKYGKKE